DRVVVLLPPLPALRDLDAGPIVIIVDGLRLPEAHRASTARITDPERVSAERVAGEDAGQARLAGARGTVQQDAAWGPAVAHLLPEAGDHGLVADDLAKPPRATIIERDGLLRTHRVVLRSGCEP